MAGLSLFLLALLATPSAAAPQDDPASAPPAIPGAFDSELSFKDLVERTYDPRWMLHAITEGEQVEEQSWSVDGNGHASVSIEGQGAVARIWLAQASGRIRIYADGAEQPSIDWDLDTLLSKNVV